MFIILLLMVIGQVAATMGGRRSLIAKRQLKVGACKFDAVREQ